MIPKKSIEITSADGLVNFMNTYGFNVRAIEAQNGAVAFTTLTDAGEASQFQTNGLLDGKTIYGRFETCEVATGTLTIHLY